MTCAPTFLSKAPSARPLHLRVLLCVGPRHIDSCRPTPFESVARSWSFPLLQLLQALLGSAVPPWEKLVSEKLGDMLGLRMLLFFALIGERLEPAATGVEVDVTVRVE